MTKTPGRTRSMGIGPQNHCGMTERFVSLSSSRAIVVAHCVHRVYLQLLRLLLNKNRLWKQPELTEVPKYMVMNNACALRKQRIQPSLIGNELTTKRSNIRSVLFDAFFWRYTKYHRFIPFDSVVSLVWNRAMAARSPTRCRYGQCTRSRYRIQS